MLTAFFACLLSSAMSIINLATSARLIIKLGEQVHPCGTQGHSSSTCISPPEAKHHININIVTFAVGWQVRFLCINNEIFR